MFPQLSATDVPPSGGQSEIYKRTQIITDDISVEAHINHSEYFRMGDKNQMCTWRESQLVPFVTNVRKQSYNQWNRWIRAVLNVFPG